MSQTVRFFRDTLSIDSSVSSLMQAQPGDTLVLAGRQVTLVGLLPDFDYVIAADQLIVAAGAATTLRGVGGNPTPSVTVLARSIEGAPLAITAAGVDRRRWGKRRAGRERDRTPGGRWQAHYPAWRSRRGWRRWRRRRRGRPDCGPLCDGFRHAHGQRSGRCGMTNCSSLSELRACSSNMLLTTRNMI